MIPTPTICIGCHKEPNEIPEYVSMAKIERLTPGEYVREQEGTYNPNNGHFWCTECYIREGMPLGVAP